MLSHAPTHTTLIHAHSQTSTGTDLIQRRRDLFVFVVMYRFTKPTDAVNKIVYRTTKCDQTSTMKPNWSKWCAYVSICSELGALRSVQFHSFGGLMKFGYLFAARDKECLQQTMTHDKNK